jgi:ferredoxin
VVGVVARGCTTRSLVLHLQERQYGREEVVIIGVPCTGYVDRKALAAVLDGADIREGSLTGDKLVVQTAGGKKEVLLADVLADNCRTCKFNNPVLNDVMVGEPASAMAGAAEEYAAVEAFEKLPPEERWAYFTKEMSKCIRCYACRQACPSCYCKICFVEQTQPQWVGLGEDATDTQVFQFMRLYHMVGRCVDCGSCVSVCPMGVDLRKFLKKLDKDAFDFFGNRAGSSLDDPPPLSTFKEHDKEDFIYNP